LLPKGQVQANVKGGPVWPRLEFWIKMVGKYEQGTKKSLIEVNNLEFVEENKKFKK